MGREIRRVAMNWQHPKNERGYFIPLYDETYEDALAQFNADKTAFESDPVEKAKALAKGCTTYEEWNGNAPDPETHRPKWDDDAVLGWCYYENVTEGTPISPVLATSDELAQWLVENEDMSLIGAKKFIEMGWSMSAIVTPETGYISGIEYIDWEANQSSESE